MGWVRSWAPVGVSFISAAAAARGSGLDTEQQPTITLRPAMQLSNQSHTSQPTVCELDGKYFFLLDGKYVLLTEYELVCV